MFVRVGVGCDEQSTITNVLGLLEYVLAKSVYFSGFPNLKKKGEGIIFAP